MGYRSIVDFVAVIGDVVGSRRHPDRAALHHALTTALGEVNPIHGWSRAPRVTVGDEFQAGLPSLDDALAAIWDLRAALLPRIDVRFGVGLGHAALLDPAAHVEDGTAWWAARAAIEAVKAEAGTRGGSDRRVRILLHQSIQDPMLAGAVRAADAAQGAVDAAFAGLEEIDLTLLRGLRAGIGQAELGREVGLGQSTVSYRVKARGIGLLRQVRTDLVRHA